MPIPWLLALIRYLHGLLVAHTLFAIGAVIFVEELGIPFVVPGDLTMMLAGVRVAEGRASLWQVLLVEELATLVGAGLLFLAARGIGRPLVLRFGEYVGIGPERLANVEARVRAHEMRTVIVGRLIPGLRVITVIAAGVVGVRPARFFPALALGAFVYLFAFTALGALAGPPLLRLFARLVVPVDALWSAAALAVLVIVVRALRASEPARLAMHGSVGTFVVGGLLAAFAGLLASNVLLGTFAVVARVPESVIDLKTIGASSQLRLVWEWPLFVGAALAVAGIHGLLRLRERLLLARLAVSFGAPLAATLLLIEPLGDAGGFDMPATIARVVGVSAAVRWGVFAILFEWLPGPVLQEPLASR